MFLSSHADKSDFNFQKKSTDDRDDLYTSLLSNQSYASHEDTSYFSGSLSRSGDKNTSSTEDFTSGSNFLLTSDSDIKINPSADQSDSAHKIHDTEKAFDSSYNYMDISRKEDSCSSQRPLEDWRMSGLSEPIQYTKLEKSPSPVEVDMEDIGSAAILDSQTFPYVEEPSDEELSDYQPYRSPGTGSSASPVKITLTEMPSDTSVSPTTVQHSPTVTVSEKESILSLGLEGVPTVTLSEPEDESPESSTPPTGGLHHPTQALHCNVSTTPSLISLLADPLLLCRCICRSGNIHTFECIQLIHFYLKNEQFCNIKETGLVEKAAKPVPNILENFKLGQK